METNNPEFRLTLGAKLKSARKSAGLTQTQLAEKLMVSRQAVTKWESDKGLPDIENLKNLSHLLNVSLDYLLDGEGKVDLSVTRKEINLNAYDYKRKFNGRWVKKAGKKDLIVKEHYPEAEIYYLLGERVLTKKEKIADNVLGFVFSAPFGIPQFLNSIKNTDKEFYLVNENNKQFLVTVTDDYIESRQFSQKITEKKFTVGEFNFRNCGLLK